MIKISEHIKIEGWELTETFTTSQGPGGQNVNKVSTAVELRFSAATSPNLTAVVKSRLKKIAGRRWSLDGSLVILAQETRSQSQNRAIARNKLIELIVSASFIPVRRIPTRPTLGSQKRRISSKKKRGEIKILRGKVEKNE
ncbi:MAG: alternative ribosome rescue aminoacyl-tRNA hydrolase ArfB [Proteobacteria bacterium]|jgi:ribosome-associated protein|nr:alternative ribosome rescue aminoacyl-tRNA hydrolase ArfB [Pseudomonadota bacterium]MDA1237970.1 alternative ribosome rescue aminoacyl-tRNA hydrolase ArfB [Pseudomonadota bacterium]